MKKEHPSPEKAGSTSSLQRDSLEVISRGPEKTRELGASLGSRASPGDVFLLKGDLGTGKTCFVQGMGRGLGVKNNVASPSFVLVREYAGRLPLYHIDLYRLGNLEEVAFLGLEGYLYSQGVCAIEWAEKGEGLFPEEHLLVELEFVSSRKRLLRFKPKGEHYRSLVISALNEISWPNLNRSFQITQ